MEPFSYPLWFAVRYVHLVSIAVLAGGAFMVYALSARPGGAESQLGLTAAVAYELTFWLLSGVTMATGVSNLGLKGEGLLGIGTGWGKALMVKLVSVAVLLVFSAIRTDFVARSAQSDHAGGSDRRQRVLQILYGLTTAVFLGVAWIGLGLAHGRY